MSADASAPRPESSNPIWVGDPPDGPPAVQSALKIAADLIVRLRTLFPARPESIVVVYADAGATIVMPPPYVEVREHEAVFAGAGYEILWTTVAGLRKRSYGAAMIAALDLGAIEWWPGTVIVIAVARDGEFHLARARFLDLSRPAGTS